MNKFNSTINDFCKDPEVPLDEYTTMQCELLSPQANKTFGFNLNFFSELEFSEYPELLSDNDKLFDFNTPVTPLELSSLPVLSLNDDLALRWPDGFVFSRIPSYNNILDVSYPSSELPKKRIFKIQKVTNDASLTVSQRAHIKRLTPSERLAKILKYKDKKRQRKSEQRKERKTRIKSAASCSSKPIFKWIVHM